MIFSPWKILLFVIAAVVMILALMAVPGRHRDLEEVDPRTGESLPTAGDMIETARNLDDARVARDYLQRQLALNPNYRKAFADALRILQSELLMPPALPSGHPVLVALLRPRFDRRVALLESALFDKTVAAETERFFAKSPAESEKSSRAPDALARALSARLRRGVRAPRYFVEVARAFERAGRARARLRWLLRGYRAFPDSVPVRNSLISAYIANGRLIEAFAVTSDALARDPTDLAFWRHRARLAGWLSLPQEEVAALEIVAARTGERAEIDRLLELCVYLGQPDRAVPYVSRLAEAAGETLGLENAANLAFASGVPERGFQLLEQLADEDPGPMWRERIAELAEDDLQLDRAIEVLQQLASDFPDHGYRAKLERLYRIDDRPEELAALLEQRLETEPEDVAAWREAITLRAALGQRARADQLFARLSELQLPPVDYLENLPALAAIGIGDAAARGLAIAESASMPANALAEVVDALMPMARQPAFRKVIETVLGRFPNDPRVKHYRLALVDLESTPATRAQRVEALAAAYPDDPDMMRAWIDRAAWAGLLDSEIRAREALLKCAPDNRDNRARLAFLYQADERYADAANHWDVLASDDGLRSNAADRLVAALLAAGDVDRAITWLVERTKLGGATAADSFHAARLLFEANRYREAAEFYAAGLKRAPDDPEALLRLGQMKLWDSRHAAALQLFRHRLEVEDSARALVWYYIGECHRALAQPERAAAADRAALAALATETAPEDTVLEARLLWRTGRTADGVAKCREALARSPDNLGLVTDGIDMLLAAGELTMARDLLETAVRLDATDETVLQLESQLLSAEGDYDGARKSLERAVDLYGPDAASFAAIGAAAEAAGEWQYALGSYRRWLALQSRDRDAIRAVSRLEDDLADLALGTFYYRRVGNDRTVQSDAGASIFLDHEHTRLNLRAGYGSYSGRAQVVAGGTQDVVTDTGLFDASVIRRVDSSTYFGSGLSYVPGATGNLPLGAWGAFHRHGGDDHYWMTEARLYLNEVMTAPAAAVGLGGRLHSAEGSYFREFGDRWWASGEATLGLIELSPDGMPGANDGLASAQISLGRVLVRGEQQVADRYRPRRAPARAWNPYLGPHGDDSSDWMVQAWLSYQPTLLFGGDVSQMIPIGDKFQYVLATGRADWRATEGLGTGIEGYLGHDLANGNSVWALRAAADWRPSRSCEFTFRSGVGRSLLRSDGGESFDLMAQFILRW